MIASNVPITDTFYSKLYTKIKLTRKQKKYEKMKCKVSNVIKDTNINKGTIELS